MTAKGISRSIYVLIVIVILWKLYDITLANPETMVPDRSIIASRSLLSPFGAFFINGANLLLISGLLLSSRTLPSWVLLSSIVFPGALLHDLCAGLYFYEMETLFLTPFLILAIAGYLSVSRSFLSRFLAASLGMLGASAFVLLLLIDMRLLLLGTLPFVLLTNSLTKSFSRKLKWVFYGAPLITLMIAILLKPETISSLADVLFLFPSFFAQALHWLTQIEGPLWVAIILFYSLCIYIFMRNICDARAGLKNFESWYWISLLFAAPLIVQPDAGRWLNAFAIQFFAVTLCLKNLSLPPLKVLDTSSSVDSFLKNNSPHLARLIVITGNLFVTTPPAMDERPLEKTHTIFGAALFQILDEEEIDEKYEKYVAPWNI